MGKGIEQTHQVSCPFCGARSSVSVPVVVTKPEASTQACPACGQPWRVRVWNRRGVTEFAVEPGGPADGAR